MEQQCPKCGQTDVGQYGEYPCPECGLPLTWGEVLVMEEESESEQ